MQSDNFDGVDSNLIDPTYPQRDPAMPPYEAVRFGSTGESARAIYKWAQTHTAYVYAGILFGERDRLQVRADSHDYELYKGDYLALVPVDEEYYISHRDVGGFNREATHQFRLITDTEWAILFGESAQHPMPDDTTPEAKGD